MRLCLRAQKNHGVREPKPILIRLTPLRFQTLVTDIFQYFTVYILSTVKFIFGPALGVTYGLGIPETVFLNVLGMVTPAYLVQLFGDKIRIYYKKWFIKKDRKIFTKRNRTFVKVWKKYGLAGVAFLVPLILMPIPGAIIANTFSKNTWPYIKWLWIFGAIFSTFMSFFLRFGKDLLSDFIV